MADLNPRSDFAVDINSDEYSNPDKWAKKFGLMADQQVDTSSDQVPYAPPDQEVDNTLQVTPDMFKGKELSKINNVSQLYENPQPQQDQGASQPPQQSNEPARYGNVQISQRFGNPNAALYGRNNRGQANINRGVDIPKKPGQPQFAPSNGKWVVQSAYTGNKFNTGWGRSVVLKNLDTGETLRRSHLDKVYAQPGQVVTGKPLGTTGRTGRTTGFHADVEYTNPQGRLADYSKSRYFGEEGRS